MHSRPLHWGGGDEEEEREDEEREEEVEDEEEEDLNELLLEDELEELFEEEELEDDELLELGVLLEDELTGLQILPGPQVLLTQLVQDGVEGPPAHCCAQAKQGGADEALFDEELEEHGVLCIFPLQK